MMSRRHKNNHYHYAEQFEDRARKARRRGMAMPKRFILLGAILALIFSVITVTFSADFTPETVENTGGGSLIVRARNSKANHDLAATGANVDLASTGWSFSGGDLIFDNTLTQWSDNSIQLIIGKSDYSSTYNMTKVTNTNYYSVALPTSGWSDATYMAVVGNSSAWGSGSWGTSNLSNANHRTGTYTSGLDAKAKETYVLTPESSSNGCSIGLTYGFDGSGNLDIVTLKAHACYSTDGGSTYTENDKTGGTVDIESYYFSSASAISSSSIGETHLAEYNAAKTTASVNSKFKAASKTGYTFKGWYSNKTKTTLVSSSATYNYSTNGGDKELWAFFDLNDYTISYNAGTQGSPSYTGAEISGSVASTTMMHGVATTLSSSTFTRTGFTQDGWATSNGGAKVYNLGGSYTATGDATLYPHWSEDTYTVTYNKGTAGSGTIPSTTKRYWADSSVTLSSSKFTRSGFTQVGWATAENYTSQTSGGGTTYYALGGSYSSNVNVTLYPVWELNAPTKLNDATSAPTIISAGSMTIGGEPVNLSLSVSAVCSEASRVYSFYINGPAGDSSIGVNPADLSTFMKFTTTVPGTYTVRITVTDTTSAGVINSGGAAAATTANATITVYPDAPSFDLTMFGYNTGSGSDGDPYKILVGSSYYFQAEVDSAYVTSHPTSDYTYTWSTNADFAAGHLLSTNATSFYFNEAYAVITGGPDGRTLAFEPTDLRARGLYCRVTRNGASADSTGQSYSYIVQPLIREFKYEPFQKVFNEYDEKVTLAAQYNMDNDPLFTNQLFFSSDNYSYGGAVSSASGFITSYTGVVETYLFPAGPKYFFMSISGPNSVGETVRSPSSKIHTTVGTDEGTTDRPLYFDNAVASTSLKNYLVMCYYIDGDGELGYQAAQDLYKGDADNAGLHYRVNIPSNASAVCFGFVSEDTDHVRYYGSATLENGVISGFSAPVFKGCTEQVSLSPAIRKIRATSNTISAQVVNTVSYDFWSFDCDDPAVY